MVQHPRATDLVTAEGLEHVASCPTCQFILDLVNPQPKEPAMPRMQPDGVLKITLPPQTGGTTKRRPNINRVEPHKWCQRLAHDETFSSRRGDIRVCKHGKVQVRTETGPGSTMIGPGTDWWRDLHPFWTPILYRRAKAALGWAR